MFTSGQTDQKWMQPNNKKNMEDKELWHFLTAQ